MLKQILNNVEIKKAERFQKKAGKLHMTSPTKAVFNYVIEDIEASNTLKKYKQLSHSYTRNFHNFIFMTSCFVSTRNAVGWNFHGEGSIGTKLETGALGSTLTNYVPVLGVRGNQAGDLVAARARSSPVDAGIVVGTDDTPETLDDFAMGAKILSGVDEGQLTILTPLDDAAYYNNVNKTWYKTFSRAFVNNSPSSITIGELGLVISISTSTSEGRTLLIRDALTTPAVVEVGKQITFTYEFSYVMPG